MEWLLGTKGVQISEFWDVGCRVYDIEVVLEVAAIMQAEVERLRAEAIEGSSPSQYADVRITASPWQPPGGSSALVAYPSPDEVVGLSATLRESIVLEAAGVYVVLRHRSQATVNGGDPLVRQKIATLLMTHGPRRIHWARQEPLVWGLLQLLLIGAWVWAAATAHLAAPVLALLGGLVIVAVVFAAPRMLKASEMARTKFPGPRFSEYSRAKYREIRASLRANAIIGGSWGVVGIALGTIAGALITKALGS